MFTLYLCDRLVATCDGKAFTQLADVPGLQYLINKSPEQFLTSRVLPQCRWNMDASRLYHLGDWSPLLICRKTHGLMAGDDLWIKFPEDPPDLDWETVKKQVWE